MLWAIGFYRSFLSPLKGSPSCRFHPSCSAYAEQAVVRFGPWRGGWLALLRLARCHPWNEGGFDPVPEHLGRVASHKDAERKSV
jgi:putative membrane protein insertion efficiency factor